MRQPARLHEATCPAARWAVGVRRCGGREGLGDRGASGGQGRRNARRRLLDDERAGGGRRRARPRQVERLDAVRRPVRPAFRGRRARTEAALGRLPAAAASRELRATPSRRPAARPLARGRLRNRHARRSRSVRSHTVPFEPDRGRRQRPRGDEDRAQPRARRRLRQRPPRRDDRADRDRLQHAAAAAVQGAGERHSGGERRRTRQQPCTRGLVQDRQLAAFLQGEGPPRGDVVAPAARAVSQRAASRRVLRARPADGADRRSPQGARTDRLGLHRRRRPHRVCVANRASTWRPSAGSRNR